MAIECGAGRSANQRCSFADRHFSGRSPLGARSSSVASAIAGYWYTIVGVVRELRSRGSRAIAAHRLSCARAGRPDRRPTERQRRSNRGRAASIVAAGPHAIWSVDENQPVAQVQTVEEIVTRQLSVPSQNTVLFGAFALLALLLASIGLYGVLSYAVTQRTNEIGVPVALGARSRDILIFFSRRGLTLTLGGLAIGVLLSVMAPGRCARCSTISSRTTSPLSGGLRRSPHCRPPGVSGSLAPRVAHRSGGRPAAGNREPPAGASTATHQRRQPSRYRLS